MRILMGVLALSLCADQASAQKVEIGGFMDGNDLSANCADDQQRYCQGYIAGVVDMIQFLRAAQFFTPTYCLPPYAQIRQLAAVVRQYLIQHPEQWHETGAYIVGMALNAAFPWEGSECQSRSTITPEEESR